MRLEAGNGLGKGARGLRGVDDRPGLAGGGSIAGAQFCQREQLADVSDLSRGAGVVDAVVVDDHLGEAAEQRGLDPPGIVDEDRKSTRLNSSHVSISYAVF